MFKDGLDLIETLLETMRKIFLNTMQKNLLKICYRYREIKKPKYFTHL